jgi:hypothetical protein
MDASYPEILFLYTAIVPAAPEETVRDAGIEPGTAALQSVVTLALSQLSHHIPKSHHIPVSHHIPKPPHPHHCPQGHTEFICRTRAPVLPLKRSWHTECQSAKHFLTEITVTVPYRYLRQISTFCVIKHLVPKLAHRAYSVLSSLSLTVLKQ